MHDELGLFFTDQSSQDDPGIHSGFDGNYFLHVGGAFLFAIAMHVLLLTAMIGMNHRLMVKYTVDDFPLFDRVNPLIVATGQFFFSALFLFPFCARQFVKHIQLSIGAILLTAIPYVASIVSSLAHGYFFKPPPYYQLRSFSISCAFFIGFFNRHFVNFPDTIIATGMMICGSLIASGRSTEFYFPYLVFGLASSVAAVQYPFGLRHAIVYFRRKFILLAFSLNLCSFCLTLPVTLACADFRVFRSPIFNFTSFLWTWVASGLTAGALCVTSSVLIYFSSPLHYVVVSTFRSHCTILYRGYVNPLRWLMTPGMFFGNWICVASGVMVILFHLQKIRDRSSNRGDWRFPASLFHLLGLTD